MHAPKLVTAVILIMSGCAETVPRQVTAPTPVPQQQQQPAIDPSSLPRPMASVMRDHFSIASWARDSVVAGDLDALREPLQEIADYEYPEQSSEIWRSSLQELQQLAKTTATTDSLSGAARGVASMARLCGRCHATAGGGPESDLERREAFSTYGESTFTGRMYRHAWGNLQLWQGLTAPSDESWQLGAAALAEAPNDMELELPPRFGQELARLREIGRDAQLAGDEDQRTELYARLLTTCATCHAGSNAAALRGH
jgi:cytochrome c553